MSVDYAGIATLLGALGAFLGVIVSLSIQIINFRDSRARHAQLDEMHKDIQDIKNAP